MGQTRSDERITGGAFLGAVFGVFTLIFILFATSTWHMHLRSKIEPEKTYRVFDVTDGTGKIYRNLNQSDGNIFTDIHGNQYSFHGNYTVITRKVSGEQFLEDTGFEK